MALRLSNSIFIHIPRTGGHWLEAVLKEIGCLKQSLLGDFESTMPYRQLPKEWQELTPFTFIRHPLDWVKSRWSHALRTKAQEEWRMYGIHWDFNQLVRPTFQETIEVILEERPGITSETLQVMTEGVNHLLLTEELHVNDDLSKLLEELEGIPESLIYAAIHSVDKLDTTATLPEYVNEMKLTGWIEEKFLESEKVGVDLYYKIRNRNNVTLPLPHGET